MSVEGVQILTGDVAASPPVQGLARKKFVPDRAKVSLRWGTKSGEFRSNFGSGIPSSFPYFTLLGTLLPVRVFVRLRCEAPRRARASWEISTVKKLCRRNGVASRHAASVALT